jgi:hypothetical protein
MGITKRITRLGPDGNIPNISDYYIFHGYDMKPGQIKLCYFREERVFWIKTVINISVNTIEFDIAGDAGLSEFFTFSPHEFWYITVADAEKCYML